MTGPSADDPLRLQVAVVDLNGAFGPLKSLLELVPGLEENHVDLHLVVPAARVDSLRGLVRPGAVVPVEAAGAVQRDIAIARAIARMDVRPDVIHANSTSAARGAVLAGLRTRVPVLVHLRNSNLSTAERRFLRGLAMTSRADFVAVSSWAVAVAGLRSDQCSVLRDAVTSSHRRPDRDLVPPYRIGIVANSLPTKGFDVFVRIAAATLDLPLQWEVYGSAGRDPKRNPYLEEGYDALAAAGALSRVRLHGLVDDLREHLPDLDVMLLTSRRESFLRVAVEALLARVPLIAPDIPGLSEAIDDDRWARRYRVADPDEAVASLRDVLAHHEAAMALATTGEAWARSRYSPAEVARDLSAIYRGLRRA